MGCCLGKPLALSTALGAKTTHFDWLSRWLFALLAAQDLLDVEGQIAQMHFPHIRLNQSHGPTHTDSTHDGFYTWETADDFKQEWRPPPPVFVAGSATISLVCGH